AGKLSASARKHNTAGEKLLRFRAREFFFHKREDLGHTRLNDFGERGTRNKARRTTAGRWHFKGVTGPTALRVCYSVLTLNTFRSRKRGTQTSGDIVREMIPAHRYYGGVAHRTTVKHRKIGCPTADINDADSKLLLLGR